MTRIIRKIEQLFCFCPLKQCVKRREGSRVYLECMRCGKTTPGVKGMAA